jgi:hypothetical protein
MRAEKALELVGRYARLTKAIRGCKKRIGECLDKCHGLNGKRLETFTQGSFDGGADFGFVEAYEMLTDAAMQDQDTHLKVWYGKEYGETEDHGCPVFVHFTVGEGDEEEECPHCYAAHLIVQERKGLRRQLAAVKGAMSRSIT